MEVYYKNATLFVEVINDINVETLALMERRIFNIIEDYGVDKIVVSIFGLRDKGLLNQFKKNYYHKYKGFLLIK